MSGKHGLGFSVCRMFKVFGVKGFRGLCFWVGLGVLGLRVFRV